MERKDLKGRILHRGEYQQASGKNAGRYEYKYIDNDKSRKSVYSWRLTPKDTNPKGKYSELSLRELEEKIQEDLEAGVVHDNSTYESVYNLWIEHMRKRVAVGKLKKSTLISYEHQSSIWINPYFNKLKISKIDADIVLKYFEICDKRLGLSGSTIKRLSSILSGVLSFSDKVYARKTNAVYEAIKRFEETHNLSSEKVNGLTEEQQKRLIDYCRNSKYKVYLPVICFCLSCGCRIGEAGAITYDDIDFTQKKVRINKTLNVSTNKNNKQEIWVGTPKTENGVREIPLLNDLIVILQEEVNRQAIHGKCRAKIDGIDNFFFINSYRNPITRTAFNTMLRKLRSSFNMYETKLAASERRNPVLIDHLSSNSFRKSFTTLLANEVANPFIVKSILGHSKITTTDKYYYDSFYEIKEKTFNESLEGKLCI